MCSSSMHKHVGATTTTTATETADPTTLISRMTAYMAQCMRNHDPSHNPRHVHRVVHLAHQLLASERARNPSSTISMDDTAITLAALLHDIEDRKYLPSPSHSGSSSSNGVVYHAMLSNGANPVLAARVNKIISHVSFSTEVKDPDLIRRLIDKEGYPELAIVQDADRLDALGAVGIARCFTYLGAKGGGRAGGGGGEGEEGSCWELDQAIEHFGEKLEKLEGMMKTESGREMARVRTERLKVFREWWEEENGER
ncbi:hypothetical protein PAAG_05635 [Paracoccidioides lutzii Pb01]|uniref:HD/PDEase domain-containing protein n=1 Tax=Paracoccidioides lutzii (strain ATCC MYA-826 / Pb01) TaxID=502779 RepID=C1H4E2_PARBA|nr:hypothetical protein PAAG_05635 [Paracoccidioides lutzii Pb01]EEH34586.1 hypothetical protein PAAG_05635 [Paracoccidioides lutzii Pb01]